MSSIENKLSSSIIEASAKLADESIAEFESYIQEHLPEGLNSKLSRHERSLLKTYIMWADDRPQTLSDGPR